MNLKYALYVLLLVVLFVSAFTYFRLEEPLAMLESRERELTRLSSELVRKEEILNSLKQQLEREKLRIYSEEEALKVLMSFLDGLRDSYEVKVLGDVRREGNVWIVNLRLSSEVESGVEIAERLERLVRGKAPVIRIRSLRITRGPVGKIDIELDASVPFAEVRG